METRQWLPLISVVISVFVFNMSEFIPIGLLTGISSDFGVSESTAGLIISVYAWAVAILSLPMMLVFRRMEYRRMLIMAVALFTLFQFVSGVSADYGMLMVSRIGVAASHAVFWSIAPVLAVRIVPTEYTKLALSSVSAGTAIAMVVGLPVGRIIGLALGWRMAFMLIAAISVAVLLLMVAVFPRVENPGTFSVKRLPEIYHNKTLVCIYVITALYVTGCYTAYSYIEPFLAQVGGFDDLTVTAVLVVFGMAGFLGSMIFARLYGRSKYVFIVCVFAVMAAALFLFRPAADFLITTVILCIAWSASNICFNTSFQNETLSATPSDSGPVAMSLFSGIYNVGIAMGPIVGGAVIDGWGIGNIGYTGSVFILAAAAVALLLFFPCLRRMERSE